jgi:hypothetical protein
VITSGPVALAAMRAQGCLDVTDLDEGALRQAREAAGRTGRTLLRVPDPDSSSAGWTLGWSATQVPTLEDGEHGEHRQLTRTSLLTWVCCLGLAWPARTATPHPGRAFTWTELLAAAAALHVTEPWARSAVLHTLEPAGLVRVSDQALHLGPAAAALPESFTAALRRVHDRLPKPAPESSAPEHSSPASAGPQRAAAAPAAVELPNSGHDDAAGPA